DLLSISSNEFTLLSKTGITNTGGHTTLITGNIGSSPITAAALNNVFCSEMSGTSRIYGVDAAYTGSGAGACFFGNPGVPVVVPPDANKTLVDNAVLDMGTAYTDAAGRLLLLLLIY
ncbi:MAG: ice-binding family protein, partial [bacterium]|nr:ice-binding family protein [bacterium]